ncbi:hypothetical protein MTO96_006278 [Rhipicephalus appendiculatus]
MFPASAARFVLCLIAALLVVLGRQPEAVVRGEDSLSSRDMVVVTSGTMAGRREGARILGVLQDLHARRAQRQ